MFKFNPARASIVLIFVALAAIGASWSAWMQANAELHAEIRIINQRFEQMSAEHDAAINAANSAMAMRAQVEEQAYAKAENLEAVLSGLSDICLPDSLRQALGAAAYERGAAAGTAAGAHPDTGPPKD